MRKGLYTRYMRHLYTALSLTLSCSTGPPPSQIFVRISGSAVDETITALPATVTFNISDDDSAVEANEVYFLTLTSDDPDVLFQQDTTQIMITDDDRMLLTYACAIHIQGYRCITAWLLKML